MMYSFEITSLLVRYQIVILLLPLYQSSTRLGYIWFYYISQKPYVLHDPNFLGCVVLGKHGLRAWEDFQLFSLKIEGRWKYMSIEFVLNMENISSAAAPAHRRKVSILGKIKVIKWQMNFVLCVMLHHSEFYSYW